MCTININTLEIDRQVFWQTNYLHSSEINLINKKWYDHRPCLICSRVPSHQNPNVFVAPSINSWVAGLPVFSRTILGIAEIKKDYPKWIIEKITMEENMQKRDPNSLETNPIEPITKQEGGEIINN